MRQANDLQINDLEIDDLEIDDLQITVRQKVLTRAAACASQPGRFAGASVAIWISANSI